MQGSQIFLSALPRGAALIQEKGKIESCALSRAEISKAGFPRKGSAAPFVPLVARLNKLLQPLSTRDTDASHPRIFRSTHPIRSTRVHPLVSILPRRFRFLLEGSSATVLECADLRGYPSGLNSRLTISLFYSRGYDRMCFYTYFNNSVIVITSIFLIFNLSLEFSIKLYNKRYKERSIYNCIIYPCSDEN